MFIFNIINSVIKYKKDYILSILPEIIGTG